MNPSDPAPKRSVSFSALPPSQQITIENQSGGNPDLPQGLDYKDASTIAPLNPPLSFGFGELLKYGAAEGDADDYGLPVPKQEDTGKSLRGRYIVRVGWDDVRGWLGEGGTLIGSSRCPSCE